MMLQCIGVRGLGVGVSGFWALGFWVLGLRALGFGCLGGLRSHVLSKAVVFCTSKLCCFHIGISVLDVSGKVFKKKFEGACLGLGLRALGFCIFVVDGLVYCSGEFLV